MNDKEENTLQAIWASMLTTSLKQTLVMSYLNKKFPGSIQEMADEFEILSGMINVQSEIREDISKTLSGMPKTNPENSPFRIFSNEIMSDTVIQTLLLRHLMKSDPGMAKAMLEDFRLILSELELNDAVKERVTTSLSEFLPDES